MLVSKWYFVRVLCDLHEIKGKGADPYVGIAVQVGLMLHLCFGNMAFIEQILIFPYARFILMVVI